MICENMLLLCCAVYRQTGTHSGVPGALEEQTNTLIELYQILQQKKNTSGFDYLFTIHEV